MGDADKLLKQAQSHVALRRVLLVVNGLSYVMWIGSRGLGFAGGVDPGLLSAIGMIAWPVWLVSLLAIFWTMARLRKRHDIAGLVDDERTVGLTGTAFKAGYWVLLIGVAAVFAASYVLPIDVRAVMPVLLALGVAAPSLTYAALFRS